MTRSFRAVRQLDKLQAMGSFVAVVEAGSFSAAAEVIGLSKPAVSRQVSELEHALGMRLLHRTTRRLSLTDEGRLYYARCKEVIAAVQDAESELGQKSSQARGRLRIGVPQDFGVEQLASLWGSFMAENPNIELDVTLSDRTFDLVEEGYDLALRIGSLVDSGAVARPLAHVRLMLCASPDFIKRHGMPLHPGDLRNYPFISYSYHANGNDWVFRNAVGELAHVRCHSGMVVNNGATCRTMAINGLGMTVQPDFLMYGAVAQGQLVELLPQWSVGGNPLALYAIYPTRTLLPLKVKRLRDFLIKAFSAPSWTTARY